MKKKTTVKKQQQIKCTIPKLQPRRANVLYDFSVLNT